MGRIKADDLVRIAARVREKADIERNPALRARITVHMGTCGISAGSSKVLEALEDAIEKQQGQDIALVTSGCAGLCSREPMITVSMRGAPPVKYADIDAAKALRIFAEHVMQGHIVTEFALCVGNEMEA